MSAAETSEYALRGKVALITGGASGIGRASALLFARQGAGVAVLDVDSSGGAEVVREIQSLGAAGTFLQADVSRSEECRKAVRECVDRLGGLQILFNNAGIIRRASVLDLTEEEWDRTMAVNVKSIFLVSRPAIRHMAQHGGGVILNTASGWGLAGGPRAAAYCASKGAVVQLTRAMAIDHAHQNIRVNCICPGDTDTPLLDQEAAQLGQSKRHFQFQAVRRPLARLGRPDDIARAALFLVSDASAFVTGTALVVDGGGLAGSMEPGLTIE